MSGGDAAVVPLGWRRLISAPTEGGLCSRTGSMTRSCVSGPTVEAARPGRKGSALGVGAERHQDGIRRCDLKGNDQTMRALSSIRRPKPRASVLKAGIGLGLAGATLAVTATGAVFTDSTSVGSNQFSTGDVEISTSVLTDLVSFTSPKMVPGDSVVDTVTVTNAGTVEMRYAVKSTTTEDTLAAQLDLVVWDESAETTADGTCDSTPPATTLYAARDRGSVAGANLVGNPTQGAQAGDQVLAAAATQQLCFKVSLPLSTGNTFENLNTTATFAFEAEQTTNNA